MSIFLVPIECGDAVSITVALTVWIGGITLIWRGVRSGPIGAEHELPRLRFSSVESPFRVHTAGLSVIPMANSEPSRALGSEWRSRSQSQTQALERGATGSGNDRSCPRALGTQLIQLTDTWTVPGRVVTGLRTIRTCDDSRNPAEQAGSHQRPAAELPGRFAVHSVPPKFDLDGDASSCIHIKQHKRWVDSLTEARRPVLMFSNKAEPVIWNHMDHLFAQESAPEPPATVSLNCPTTLGRSLRRM